MALRDEKAEYRSSLHLRACSGSRLASAPWTSPVPITAPPASSTLGESPISWQVETHPAAHTGLFITTNEKAQSPSADHDGRAVAPATGTIRKHRLPRRVPHGSQLGSPNIIAPGLRTPDVDIVLQPDRLVPQTPSQSPHRDVRQEQVRNSLSEFSQRSFPRRFVSLPNLWRHGTPLS
jgi:hypothetical protein